MDVTGSSSERKSRRWSLKSALDLVATLVIIGAGVAMIWSSARRPAAAPAGAPPPIPVPAEPVSIEGAPLLGRPDARVVIVEFSDFECPYCGKFAREVFPAIKSKYVDTGFVSVAFRHMPLTQIHQRAQAAAEVAECAAQQGRFWPIHDLLFAEPRALDSGSLERYQQAVAVDGDRAAACRQQAAPARVAADLATAKALQLRGTPTFLFGGLKSDGRVQVAEVLPGFADVDRFSALVEEVLKAKF